MNEFNRCQAQLRELYRSVSSPHVVEFLCYRLFYDLFAQQPVDLNSFLLSLPPGLLQTPALQLALAVARAIRQEDLAAFFSLYRRPRLPFAFFSFMTQFVRRLRLAALCGVLCAWARGAAASVE